MKINGQEIEQEYNESFLLKEELMKNTLLYFLFSGLLAIFIYAVLQDQKINALLQPWLICIEANTAVLIIFHHYFRRKRKNPFHSIFFSIGFIIDGLFWGSLGVLLPGNIPPEAHVLIIMSLAAFVALGIPLITSTSWLVGIFPSAVFLPSIFYYLTDLNPLSVGNGLVIASIIPVILRITRLIRDNKSRSDSLVKKHQWLIKQLNEFVERTELANLELKKEIAEREKTEIELRKAKEEAEAAAKAKSEFLATMSHEIRTPMNGILGMAELLIKTELNSKQKRFAETIHKSGNALLTIINDILDFSKIEAGKLELNTRVFDLRLLIEDIGVMFAEQAHRKGLELICNYPADGHSMFRGDAERIRQILVNLIGNALKFTEKGEIQLKVELFEKKGNIFLIRFRVRDTGIGILPEVQEKIFESFSQADSSTTRKFGGTGLGLTICKKLTQLMKGTIGVKSKPGKGSVFWFAIPLKKEADVKQPLSRQDLKGIRILIADSNKTNREILEQQFTSWGMDYYSTDSARTTLRVLHNAQKQGFPFQLAILDNQLKDLDGVSLARKIKNSPDIADTKLIMLSSVGNMEQTGQWLMAGIESYLNKPIRQNELYQTLLNTIDSEGLKNDSFEEDQINKEEQEVVNLKGHVLVAEDNLVNQELVREMLSQLGCSAEIVDNGRKAVEVLTEHSLDNLHKPFDLVLMDCQMPEMDGFEATQNIRQWESRQKIVQRIPIIALTANAMEGDRERCLESGMDDYMTKPFNLDQLGALLHQWLPLLARENNSEYVHKMNKTSTETFNEAAEESRNVAQLNPDALNNIRKQQRGGQPNILTRVIRLFLENSQKTIQALETAISNGDPVALQRNAYSLRSSCSTVGATALAEICSELETLGKAENVDEAQTQLSVLEFEYDAVCMALNNIINSELESV